MERVVTQLQDEVRAEVGEDAWAAMEAMRAAEQAILAEWRKRENALAARAQERGQRFGDALAEAFRLIQASDTNTAPRDR